MFAGEVAELVEQVRSGFNAQTSRGECRLHHGVVRGDPV
jgi:hypothetical protein